MRLYIAIDDTDNLESRGTGKLAAMLIDELHRNQWGMAHPITRHQLYVHPDIAYTSHNSAMCFGFDTRAHLLQSIIELGSEFLARESAPGSDPGLCVAAVPEMAHVDEVIAFGFKAKEEVLSKEQAYKLAEKANIHLSEHGGKGIGVIGALAGVGLRMSGNDGRFRGKIEIEPAWTAITVASLIERTHVDEVHTTSGLRLPDNELILLGETVKPVLLNGRCIQLVYPTGKTEPGRPRWQTCTKTYIKMF
ncbi:MAG: hypothetical protein GXZ09_05380 [Syntrophomonadaceae bacterium]|jgi:hypothetical protein|nr:hypothetical protein [Syntrophomonadaceae bacterium]